MTASTFDLSPAIQNNYFVTYPGPWAGHIPFAYWLVNAHRPDIIVELGVFRGNSYFNFCHAIQEFDLSTRAYAVDTWEGDEHGGFYGDHIYREVESYNERHFSAFSTLLRATFEDSVDKFPTESIDLLHIDGYHSYDAVKVDFETWRPKLSRRGIVLFHDINHFSNDFGVWRFFEELKRDYPHFSFCHSNGLGVLMIGPDVSQDLLKLDARLPENQLLHHVKKSFACLGRLCETEAESLNQTLQLNNLESELETTKNEMTALVQDKKRHLAMLESALIIKKRLELRIDSLSFEIRRANASKEAGVNYPEISSFGSSSLLIVPPNDRVKGLLSLVKNPTRKSLTFAKLLVRRDFSTIRSLMHSHGLLHHTSSPQVKSAELQVTLEAELEAGKTAVIIATQHTLFIAYILSSSLEKLGFEVSITTEMPEVFPSRLYFVVCAQMFKRFPPASKRICVQLEQTSMSRWFTANYISTLKDSLAVIEYSSTGIRFLDALGISYPKVFHAKIGGLPNFTNYIKTFGLQVASAEKEFDVVFYGDTNNLRRQRLLGEISKHFNVKVISEVFGEPLYTEICKAKVCLNLHYYEEAELESTRIFESLSLGIPVVSETSADILDYDFSAYGNSIAFAEIGDSDSIISLIRKMIDGNLSVPVAGNHRSSNEFNFFINRLMLAIGMLNFSQMYAQSSKLRINARVVALSMPETHERRAALTRNISCEAKIFPGLRATPGWIGAAYSFKYIAKKLLESKVDHAIIFEDDAEFLDGMNPDQILSFALRIKEQRCDWDVFTALISDLHHSAKISNTFTFEDQKCVVMNRMIGMVCNVYSKRALEVLSQWDENDHNEETNTIDRYLESFDDLRIVTTSPFLARQSETLSSSMWGNKNVHMRNMLGRSFNLLQEKIWTFETERELQPVKPTGINYLSSEGLNARSFRT